MYEIERLPQSIDIGYTGEMDFRTVQIDMSEWVAKMPEGQPTLMHIRPGEYDPYPVTITYANNIITWSVTDGDLGTSEGTGLLQVWFGVQDETEVMRQLGMSAVVPTIIHLSLAGEGRNSSTVQIPWLKEVMEMKNLILGYDYEAESWANGQRGGEDVGSDDPAYHNNAKYYKEQVENMASDSEAYAAGTRGGEDVDEDDPAYENNAKYYNEQAALEKAAAQAAAETASAAYNVNLLAANYDATKTYAVGEYVIYSGGLYRCISAITTAEAWTAAHWVSVTVGKDTSALKSALYANMIINHIAPTWNQGYIVSANGTLSYDSNYCYCNYIEANGMEYDITGAAGYKVKVARYNSSKVFQGIVVALTSNFPVSFQIGKGEFFRIQFGLGDSATTPGSITDSVFTLTNHLPTDISLSEDGKAADAKVTGNELIGIKNNNAATLNSIGTSAFKWEVGTYNSTTGEDYASNSRCRLFRLPKNDLFAAVVPSNGWKVEILGYNGDAYLGVWNGQTFEKVTNFVTGKPILLNALPATRFKIVIGKTDDSTITVGDIGNALDFCLSVGYSAEKMLVPQINRYYPTGDYSVGDTVSLTPVTPSGSTKYRGIYTPCKAKDLFIISGYGGNRGRAWALLDNDYKLLSMSDGLTICNKRIVEAEQDGWFVANAEENQSYPIEIIHITSQNANDGVQDNGKEIERIKYGLPQTVANDIPETTLLYHALWDDLVTSGLVTRSEATYLTGDTDHVYPLYTYTIAARKKYMAGNYSVANDLSVIYDRPQALIISGQHGDEIVTPYILFKFIERMLTDPNYQGLLTEYDWTIIPLVNPTGFNARTRNNADDININRDYNDTTGFETEEAQYVRDVVISKDFRFALDMHQDPDDGKTSGDPRCGFISMNLKRSTETQDEYDKLHDTFCRFISLAGANTDAKMCVENELDNQGQTNFIWDSSNASGNTFKNYAAGTVGNTQHTDKAIKLVATFETSTVCWWYSHETTTYSDIVVQYTNIYAEEIIRAMCEMMRN